MFNSSDKSWRKGLTLVAVAVVSGAVAHSHKVLAQTPDRFPPSPLEITAPDPLLPNPPTKSRLLSQEEREELALALDRLNLEAQAQLVQGNRLQAFETWYRELRLRRVLGTTAEVEALGRVGAIAWAQNDSTAVRVVTRRLEAIQTEVGTQSPPDWILRQRLALAYRQVRSPERALAIYEQILEDARARQDSAAQIETLKTMGELYLGWFNYPKAAATYQELLEAAKARGDRANQIALYQQLAYIYERSEQRQPAIETRQALVELYQAAGNLTAIPRLKLAIATDYEALNQLPEAAKAYEETYVLAQTLQQFDDAAQALDKLGRLYRQQQQLEAAVEVYKILLLVNSQSYDTYGMMNTYDQLAQVQVLRKDYPQALDAFRRGLNLAEQLKIRRKYFVEQIDKVNQQLMPPPGEAGEEKF